MRLLHKPPILATILLLAALLVAAALIDPWAWPHLFRSRTYAAAVLRDARIFSAGVRNDAGEIPETSWAWDLLVHDATSTTFFASLADDTSAVAVAYGLAGLWVLDRPAFDRRATVLAADDRRLTVSLPGLFERPFLLDTVVHRIQTGFIPKLLSATPPP
jgi:hypothetical protein